MVWYRIATCLVALFVAVASGRAQGTEYVIAFPQNDGASALASDLDLTISTTADSARVTVTWPDGSERMYRVVKDRVTALTTSNGGASAAWEIPSATSEDVLQRSVRITSDQPITVHALSAKTASSDGYRAIPVRYWGRSYIVASYYDFNEVHPWSGGFCVLASEDNTTVNILLRGATDGKATTKKGRALNTGVPFTVTLQKGDVYPVFGDGTTRGVFDMTGTLVTSNKPVGVIGFHTRTAVPNSLTISGRDHLVEMLPPTSTWGTRYLTLEVPRLSIGTGKGDFFRVIAAEQGTRWKMTSYDKVTFDTLAQMSGMLNAGQFKDIAQAPARTALPRGLTVWEADRPIMVVQYSTSAEWDGDPANDPFMCLLTPVSQYVGETTVHTSTLSAFNEHRINMFVEIPDTSNPAADLMSLTINGETVWNHPRAEVPPLLLNKVPDRPTLYFATVAFDRSQKPYKIAGNNRIRIGGYVYGSGSFDTYGWPLSTMGAAVLGLDTMSPRLVVGDDACGSVTFDVLETRNIPDPPRSRPLPTDQVESGIAEIKLLEGSANSRLVFITDSSLSSGNAVYRQFKARIIAINDQQSAIAIVRATDMRGNSVIDTLAVAPSAVRFGASITEFGRVRVGAMKQIPLVIGNVGSAPLTVTGVTQVSGTNVAVARTTPSIPATIDAGDSMLIDIVYSPRSETVDATNGWDRDTIIVVTSSCTVRQPVRGMGVMPRIQMLDVLLDTVDVGETACSTLGMLITNAANGKPGTDTLLVTSIRSVTDPFFVSVPTDPALPLSIPPGGSAYLGRICVLGQGNGAIEGRMEVVTNGAEGDPTAMLYATVRGSVGVETSPSVVDVCTVAPQPAKGAMTVSWLQPLASAGALTLFDATGRIVRTVDLREGDLHVDVQLDMVGPGVYTMRIDRDGDAVHRTIVVSDK